MRWLGPILGLAVAIIAASLWFNFISRPVLDLITIMVGATLGTLVAFWVRKHIGVG